MGYPESEWERAMRVQEVMMRALSGELHWFRAAEILGVTALPPELRRAVVQFVEWLAGGISTVAVRTPFAHAATAAPPPKRP